MIGLVSVNGCYNWAQNKNKNMAYEGLGRKQRVQHLRGIKPAWSPAGKFGLFFCRIRCVQLSPSLFFLLNSFPSHNRGSFCSVKGHVFKAIDPELSSHSSYFK